MMKKVKVYSTPACPYCRRLKEYLDDRGQVYDNIDVSTDKAGLEELIGISGQIGVPVIVVDDEIIVGFEKDRLDRIL